jgi:hypothetical protein
MKPRFADPERVPAVTAQPLELAGALPLSAAGVAVVPADVVAPWCRPARRVARDR